MYVDPNGKSFILAGLLILGGVAVLSGCSNDNSSPQNNRVIL